MRCQDCGQLCLDGPYCPKCGNVVQPITFPIDGISKELVRLCQEWHSGQTSAMYSVSSRGDIYSEDILCGLQSEMRAIQGNPERDIIESDTDDWATIDKWLPILERWEATLPERD